MAQSGSQGGESPSQLIDARIKELGDWRGEMLDRLRTLLKEADPEFEKLLDEEEQIARRTNAAHEAPHFRGED